MGGEEEIEIEGRSLRFSLSLSLEDGTGGFEGEEGLGFFDVGVDVGVFLIEEILDGVGEDRVSDVVVGGGFDRFKAALDFVFPLSAGVEVLEVVGDGVVDALIVAGFKVEEVVVV